MTIEKIIQQALSEDLGSGDHTSLACIPESHHGKAIMLAKEDGIVAGTDVAESVFKQIDPFITIQGYKRDGEKIRKGDRIMQIEGRTQAILAAERTALNFIQRMSGIATFTRRLTEELKGLNTQILDTRKTTPCLRILEKMAVKAGGGTNHRFGLYDMIMIKDNHIDFAGGIESAIHKTQHYLRKNNLSLKIEIETRNFSEIEQVLSIGGVHRIMLDNFTPDNLRKAVKLIDKRFETEASGGITLNTIRKYAETGVDFISVGALTHQIKSLDISLLAVADT